MLTGDWLLLSAWLFWAFSGMYICYQRGRSAAHREWMRDTERLLSTQTDQKVKP